MSAVTVVVRAVLALACVAVTVWVATTRWDTLLAGHPAYPVLLVAVALAGIVLGLRTSRGQRGGVVRIAVRVVGALVLLLALPAIVWLRPYAATPSAADESSATIDVVHTLSTWELRPRGGTQGAGVVFYPGALVDPRAYLALLRPLAEQGHVIVVVNAPLDVALLAPGAATSAIDAHPEVRTWAVGGHSLGGVEASTVAAGGDPRVRGLFLWASYPPQDISGAPVAVASVSGDRDGLATPADIAASRADLPPATTFTVVAGGIHAFFGDYGPQSGDGEPATTRDDAQQQIRAATSALVSRAGG
jgi:Alpha/beta hydrolase family